MSLNSMGSAHALFGMAYGKGAGQRNLPVGQNARSAIADLVMLADPAAKKEAEEEQFAADLQHLGVIDEIAFQTNLLAHNAGV